MNSLQKFGILILVGNYEDNLSRFLFKIVSRSGSFIGLFLEAHNCELI